MPVTTYKIEHTIRGTLILRIPNGTGSGTKDLVVGEVEIPFTLDLTPRTPDEMGL